MRTCLLLMLCLSVMVLTRPLSLYGWQRPSSNNNAAADKPVEQVKKNIQALKGMPASQLGAVMDFFGASLGVGCNHCHAGDSSGHLRFESDDRGAKKTAREMITMVLGLNEKNFQGRLAVSCYTCHRGSVDPVTMPSLPVAMAAHEAGEDDEKQANLPMVQDILDAYEKALGGAAAIDKIKTRVSKAVLMRGGNEMQLETTQESPDRYAATMTIPNRGTVTHVYDGHALWMVTKDGKRLMSESERTRISREAPMFPLQHLRDIREQLHVHGADTVNGHTAWVLMARIGDNIRERYYIDTATSLLLRREVMNKTMIAWIPDQVDYEDYRTVNDVKIPFIQRYAYVNPRDSGVHRFTSVEQNVPVEEKKFTIDE